METWNNFGLLQLLLEKSCQWHSFEQTQAGHMSARVLLMNSKKSLLSGSLSLSKRHNHQTMNRSPQHCHQATIHPKLRKKSCPGDEVRSCRAWRWGQRLMFLPSLCSAYLLLLTLLIFYFTLYLLRCSSFVLTHRHLWPFSLLARSTTYPAWAISDDHVPSFHRWWWAIWSCTILNKPIKNPLLNKNDLSILHRLGQVGACEH